MLGHLLQLLQRVQHFGPRFMADNNRYLGTKRTAGPFDTRLTPQQSFGPYSTLQVQLLHFQLPFVGRPLLLSALRLFLVYLLNLRQ